MKNLLFSLCIATLVAGVPAAAFAQTSTANGGAGGAGGSAAGGTATGGTSTNTNSTTGGSANIGSATSNYQGADVSVNYITPAGAAGVNGLAPGVDAANNHLVTDANIRTSGTTKIKNTPDVSLGGPASGACNGLSGGIGVGIPGLAVGGNVSTVDKGCEARETARVAAMLGRMDVANAILENMDVVVAAMKAKAARDARDAEIARAQAQGASAANAAQVQLDRAIEADARAQQQAAREREAVAMRVQQQAGMDALARQATMAKVNDTLTWTGKLTQGEEQTPQQAMAADLAAKEAAAKKAAVKDVGVKDVAVKDVARNVAETRGPANAAASPVEGTAAPVVPPAAPQGRKPNGDGQREAAAQPRRDDRSDRVPVAALAMPDARAPVRDAQRKAPPMPETKRAAPDDKVDPQAAVRFALGLSE